MPLRCWRRCQGIRFELCSLSVVSTMSFFYRGSECAMRLMLSVVFLVKTISFWFDALMKVWMCSRAFS